MNIPKNGLILIYTAVSKYEIAFVSLNVDGSSALVADVDGELVQCCVGVKNAVSATKRADSSLLGLVRTPSTADSADAAGDTQWLGVSERGTGMVIKSVKNALTERPNNASNNGGEEEASAKRARR